MCHCSRLSAKKKKQLKGVRLTLLKEPLFHGSWSQRERGAQGRDTQGSAPSCFLQLHPVLGINCPEYELVGSISCSGPVSLSPFQALLSRSSLLRGRCPEREHHWSVLWHVQCLRQMEQCYFRSPSQQPCRPNGLKGLEWELLGVGNRW